MVQILVADFAQEHEPSEPIMTETEVEVDVPEHPAKASKVEQFNHGIRGCYGTCPKGSTGRLQKADDALPHAFETKLANDASHSVHAEPEGGRLGIAVGP